MTQPFFVRYLKKFLIISIVLQCICTLVLIAFYVQKRQTDEQQMVQIADRFVQKIESELQNNSNYMNQTVILRRDYRNMYQMNDLERVNKISDLQMIYKLLGEMADIPYNYFVYDREKDSFLELTRVDIQFSQYREIRNTLKERLKMDNEENKSGVWYLAETPAGRVILSSWHYENYMLGTWTRECDLLSGINTIDWGKYGQVELLPGHKEQDEKQFHLWGNSVLCYSFPHCNTDFSVQITISKDGGLKWQMLIQIFQILMLMWVIGILIELTRYVRRSFLVPTQNLIEILEKYQTADSETGKPENDTSLQDAYEILDKLGKRADSLTTKLYANELEKKQLEINFRNLQIRPHFFANCLTMLSAMAENNEIEKINKLTVCFANYYRYIMHDCMDMVTVGQEVSHMNDVIAVNDEWNSNQIIFTSEIEESAKNRKIPVLMISTFLENSIKHTVGREGILQIGLRVWTEKKVLCIRITDNGEGFQKEMLEGFRQGIYPKEKLGRHIGINNVIQRLKLIYEGQANVEFSCAENGGACVEIHIPQEETDEAFDCRR